MQKMSASFVSWLNESLTSKMRILGCGAQGGSRIDKDAHLSMFATSGAFKSLIKRAVF